MSSKEMHISRKRSMSSIHPTTSKKKRNMRKNSRPKGKPPRPLSAYNIFFRSERERMLASLNRGDTTGLQPRRMSFENLAKTIASKWHALDSGDRRAYELEAVVADRKRYRAQMEAWRVSDEGKAHELQLKKEKMARDESKCDDITSLLIPAVGDSSVGKSNDIDDKVDDGDLTPLQRMFQRVDVMAQQTQKKARTDANDTMASAIARNQTAQCCPAHEVALAPTVPLKQTMDRNDYVSSVLNPKGHTSSQDYIPLRVSAWVQETKALLNKNQGHIQHAHNIRNACCALEEHSKMSALSVEAGILPTSSNNHLPPVPTAFASSSDEKQCTTSFLLSSIPSPNGASPINTSLRKTTTIGSSPSQTSIETIDSLSNLLGSKHNIQNFLSAKNCTGKPELSAEVLERIFTTREEVTACGNNPTKGEVTRYVPIETVPGKRTLNRETRPLHVSLPTPTIFDVPLMTSTVRAEEQMPLSLKYTGTRPVLPLPRSRSNATWTVLPKTERSTMPSSSQTSSGAVCISKNVEQDLIKFVSML
uniref:HMG box domain-containing protein n=1 Tax=Odontella aurita TaxID=265563 RepID=A0A7S4J8N9_9STRA|mmetsp:Transcript_41425/g.125419  ORF Transcript_41425/g.125419 Transcript_41425/m.125419 type:complete len:534 (+) Transcript_41425:245-1846(+)